MDCRVKPGNDGERLSPIAAVIKLLQPSPRNTDDSARVMSVLRRSMEVVMHSKLIAVASAVAVMLAGTAAWAQSMTSERTPGHIMQRTPQAKSTGPGASEYAPGHLKRKYHSQSASRYTPSHRRTPSTTGMR